MRSPFSLIYLLFFIMLLACLMMVVQFGIVSMTFQKLGLSPAGAVLLLTASLAGSLINWPMFSITSDQPRDNIEPVFHGLLRGRISAATGRTIIAVNLGGCVIPMLFSVYLMIQGQVSLPNALAGTTVVSIISFMFSRTIPGMGVAMPIFIAPLTAALAAVTLNPEHSAALAYLSGTLGVLIGADLLRLRELRRIGAPLASIGGAGTFDGIFITGIVAVLLT